MSAEFGNRKQALADYERILGAYCVADNQRVAGNPRSTEFLATMLESLGEIHGWTREYMGSLATQVTVDYRDTQKDINEFGSPFEDEFKTLDEKLAE